MLIFWIGKLEWSSSTISHSAVQCGPLVWQSGLQDLHHRIHGSGCGCSLMLCWLLLDDRSLQNLLGKLFSSIDSGFLVLLDWVEPGYVLRKGSYLGIPVSFCNVEHLLHVAMSHSLDVLGDVNPQTSCPGIFYCDIEYCCWTASICSCLYHSGVECQWGFVSVLLHSGNNSSECLLLSLAIILCSEPCNSIVIT